MPAPSIDVRDLARQFNRRRIFSGITFSAGYGQAIAVTGPNGSGKSTLMKILCGVLSPSKGTVEFALDGKAVRPEDRFLHFGFVAPYLQLYDEFTGVENLRLFSGLRGLSRRGAGHLSDLLSRVGLERRKDDLVRTYSSGMKQRLKYAFALLHRPPMLLLDEPGSNLDRDGAAIVRAIIDEQKRSGLVILATNDPSDFDQCDRIIDLGSAPENPS